MAEVIDVGGIPTWYDVQGTGSPVLLLHGGLSDSGGWGLQLADLVPKHHVWLADRRGHGRTPDVEGPITYEVMADDTIAFLEQVVGQPAALVGWSDGGIVALLVALARPDLVSRLAVLGANFHVNGLHPSFLEMAEHMTPDSGAMAMLREPYVNVSPDGAGHWPVFFEKVKSMWRTSPVMTVDDLARITTPTLVIVGDDDIPTPQHVIDLYEALPDARLAIIPSASHLVPVERPDLVNRFLLEFLAEEGPPTTMMPMRRSSPENADPAPGGSGAGS